jgi:hypothetical protein
MLHIIFMLATFYHNILILFTYIFPPQNDFNFWKEAEQNIEGVTTFQQALQLLSSEVMSLG